AKLIREPRVREVDLFALVHAQREVERAVRAELAEQKRIVRLVEGAVPELLAVVPADLEIRLKRAVEREPGRAAALEKPAFGILGPLGIGAEPELVEPVVIVPVPDAAEADVDLLVADLGHETRIGPEAGVHPFELDLGPPLPRVEIVLDAERVAAKRGLRLAEARRDVGGILGLGFEVLETDVVAVADPEPAVDTGHSVAVTAAG